MHRLGLTLNVLGELCIAYMAMRVHRKVAQDRKIDSSVLKTFHQEQLLGLGGVILIIAGYVLEVI